MEGNINADEIRAVLVSLDPREVTLECLLGCTFGRDILPNAIRKGRRNRQPRISVRRSLSGSFDRGEDFKPLAHQRTFCDTRAIKSSVLERNSFRIGDVFALL